MVALISGCAWSSLRLIQLLAKAHSRKQEVITHVPGPLLPS